MTKTVHNQICHAIASGQFDCLSVNLEKGKFKIFPNDIEFAQEKPKLTSKRDKKTFVGDVLLRLKNGMTYFFEVRHTHRDIAEKTMAYKDNNINVIKCDISKIGPTSVISSKKLSSYLSAGSIFSMTNTAKEFLIPLDGNNCHFNSAHEVACGEYGYFVIGGSSETSKSIRLFKSSLSDMEEDDFAFDEIFGRKYDNSKTLLENISGK